MKSLRFIGVLLVVLLSGFIFGSCEIGLGPAVDTQPPAVTIDSPEVDVVIRDSFAISGTWSDDGEISSIKAVLSRTDKTGTPMNFDGEIVPNQSDDKSGTWKVIVNPVEQKILDGSYEVTVTIKDKGEHLTTQTRTFKIDNTAPLIVLQRPSSLVDSTSVDSYGQKFTITGQAADDNNVESVCIDFYSDKECTQKIYSKTISNVPPTIEIDVAEFAEGTENDYSKIYGSTSKDGEKKFYCSITAYDSAKRYPIDGNRSAEDDNGNSTNAYYLYEKIATAVLSNYKITDVYHMFTGTYVDSDASRSVDTIKAVKETLDENKVMYGSFTLNPASNPTFSVSGRDQLKRDGLDFTSNANNISNDSDLIIEVSVGLDAIPLVEDSLKVYLQKCDENGDVLEASPKYYPVNSTKQKSGTSYKFVTHIKRNELVDKDGNSLTVNYGDSFIIGIDGKDEKDNGIVASGKGYGIKLAASGAAPIMEFKSCINPTAETKDEDYSDDLQFSIARYKDNLAAKKENTVIRLKGYVEVEEGEPKVSIIIDNAPIDGVTLIPDSEVTGKFYVTKDIIPAEVFNNPTLSGQHKIQIKAEQNLATTSTISITYDVDAPVIRINSVTPLAYNYIDEEGNKEQENGKDKKYINGKINIDVRLQDNGRSDLVVSENETPKLEFIQEDVVKDTIYIDDSTGKEIKDYNTAEKLDDNKPVLMRISAKDGAGNRTIYEETYTVCQDTDKPVILPKDANGYTLLTSYEPTGADENHKKNILAESGIFYIRVLDDDEIKTISCIIYDQAGNKVKDNSRDADLIRKSSDYQLDVTAPSSAGTYNIKLSATDINDKVSVEKSFKIRVTKPAPTITTRLDGKDRASVYGSKEIKTLVTISSDQKPFKLYRTIKIAGGTTIVNGGEKVQILKDKTKEDNDKKLITDENPTVIDTFDVTTIEGLSTSGAYTVVYSAIDHNDIESADSVATTFYIDNEKPTIDTALIKVPTKFETESTSFKFKGSAEDKTPNEMYQSGVEKVQFTFTDETATSVPTGAILTEATGSQSWEKDVIFKSDDFISFFTTEGKKKIWVKAIDSVLNESDWVYKEFDYDISSPVAAINSYTPNGTTTPESITDLGFSTKAEFALNISSYDSNEVKRIEVYQGDNLIAVKVGNNTSFTVKNLPRATTENITDSTTDAGDTGTAVVENGTYEYKVIVYDVVDKTVKSDIVKAKIDKKPPKVTIDIPEEGENASKGINAINSATFKFSGTSTDGNEESATGVDKIWYQIKEGKKTELTAPAAPTTDTNNPDSWTDFKAVTGTSSWNFFGAFKAKGAEGEELPEGTYTVYVYAVDKAGNVSSTPASVEFDVDMKDPKVTTTWGDNSEFNSSTTQIKTGSYTIKYKVEETNGYESGSPLLTVKKDNVDIGTTTSDTTPYYTESTADANGYKTVTVVIPEDVNGDGLYEYTIYAKDVVGKETSITRNVRLDTKAPVVTVISPTLTEYQNSEYVKISGSAEDDSGTLAVWYAYAPSTTPTKPATDITNDSSWISKGWTKAKGTTNWKITGDVTNNVDSGNGGGILGVEGTSKDLYIVAVDKNGLDSAITPTTLKVDLSAPTSNTTTTDMFTNETFTLTGDVHDRNGIESVSISDGTNTYTPSLAQGSGSYANAKDATSKATWTQQFEITTDRENGAKSEELSDGSYTFTITTTDIAGKTTVKTRSVTIDTTNPVIDTKKLTFADNPTAGVPHGKDKADLELTYTETNLDQIYYYINDGSDSTIDSPAKVTAGSLWNTIIPVKDENGNNIYKKTLSFNDGEGVVYLRVTDKASNETTDTSLSYAVDTKAPEAPTLVSVDGETLSGDKLVNGTKDVKFKVTVKDLNSATNALDPEKVASVNLSAVGSTPVTNPTTEAGKGTQTNSTTGEWEITIPASKFSGLSSGTVAIKIKAKDKSGNEAEYEVFSVALDNTKPKSEIKIPASSTINGTLDITGTVTENNPKSVSLYYSTAETAPTASPTTTSSGWTPVTGATKTVGTGGVTTSDISNFTFSSIDVNTLSGASSITNKQHVLHLLAFATDTAGNECEIGSSSTIKSVKTYTVDMDADRPIIKFNNIELGASMSSTARTGFENRELYGSVSDDDGIKEIKYYIGDSMPAKDATSWISQADNSNFTYSSGSFTIKFLTSDGKASDGVKNIFFRVTDNADNVFLSSTSTTYDVSSIKVTDGTNNYGYRPNSGTTTNASAVYLKVDTTAPSVAESGYTKAATPDSGDTGWSQEITSSVFGGTNNKFYIRQYAYDTNGISSVVLHIPYDATDSGVSGYSNTAATTKPSVSGYYEYKLTKQDSGTSAKDTKAFNGITYDKYVSSEINVTGMVSGTRPCEIIASDGIKTQITSINVSIDNKAPVVKVQSQAENEQLRAGFLMKGIFEDGDQGTKLWYSLSKNTTPGTWSSSEVEKTTAMEWSIYFDGDQTPQDGYTHDVVPKNIVANVYSDTVEIATTGNNTGKAVWKAAGTGHSAGDLYTPITTVYFHFKVQDEIGNENTSYLPLKLDPQGDIPIITQVSPTEEILSGIIRFTGTADDDNKIAGLYIEIDPQYNGTNFVPWSSTHTTTKGKSPEDIMTSANYPNNPYELINNKVDSSKKKPTTIKAIYIGNGLSWNIALNKYAEWDPLNGNQSVAVRFYATDIDGNMSLASDVYTFQIDSDSPKIGSSVPFYLKQYSKNADGTETVTASMEYTDGMWLKGEWWLEGSVEDESGIASVTMNSSETGLTKTEKTWGSGSARTYGYIVKYKVGSTTVSAGKLTYKLETTDNDSTPKLASRDFIINYDNKAPTLQPSTGDDFNINENVVNDNGFYMVQSAAEEGSSESGFDRAIFYFERTTSGYEAVYDSYIAKGKTGNKVTGLTKDATDNLYWVTKTTSAVSGKNVTVPNSANIHKGGLAKFGGALYKITDISVGASNTIVTLDKTLDETLAGQSISFVIGHVVDHTGTESTGTKAGIITNKDAYGYGYYGNSPDDDGDLMIEKVQTNGTKTVWNGTINSANIPDGPIEIHYVVFDKAGNSAHGVVTGKVSNNAPRLAGVTVWTDYNGNGKGWRNSGEHAADYESETKSKYYSTVRPMIGGKTTEKSKTVTNKLIVSSNDLGIGDSNGSTKGNAFMKVTDTVKVIPEIVGGNDGLYYQYSIGKQKTDGTLDVKKSGGTTASKLKLLKDDGSTQVNGVDETDDDVIQYDSNTTLNYIDGHTDGVITFTAADILSKIDNSSSEDPTWFDIIIWDSTEGGTPYAETSGTLNCEMQIALNNQYNDAIAPKAYIRPFYWNSKTDNSVVWDKLNSTDENNSPFGHIELEDDLPTTFTTGGSGVNDRDPKVSGKIKIEGYAFDNIRLKELQVAFNDATTGTQAATYANGTWTGKKGTGWSMTAENVFANSNGHMAHWVLTVDTELIVSTKAAANQIVKVLAIDERGSNGGNKSTFGTSQTQKFVTAAEWGKISAENKAANTYYMDASCTTAVIPTAVTNTTVVYLPQSYKWSAVKNQANATTTYFIDPTFTSLADNNTTDDTVVYKNPMTSYYKMDIVPYITGLGTRLDDAYADNTSVFNRSANGKYPVRRGETGVKLYGFNLNGTSTTVKFNGNSVGTVTEKPSTDTTEPRNYVTFTVPATATSGAVSIEVNSIASLNNKNDDSKEYNKEGNGINNNTLTDTRGVYVWGTTQVVNDGTVRYPTFRVGKDTNQSYVFSYDKGGTATYLNKNGTEYFTGESFTQWYDTAVAIDAGGKLFGLALNGDCASPGSTSTNHCASLYFYPNVSSNLKVWAYTKTTTFFATTYLDFAESGAYAWENTSDGTTYRPNRIMNPKIVSRQKDNNNTDIYSVYYDASTSSIKFRYGEVNNTTPSVDSLKNYSNGSRGSAKDYYTISSGATVGTYAAVGATSNGTAVVCWKDGNSLMYKYNTTPSDNSKWSDAITVDSDYVGEYCDLAVDAAGGIHMAYFRAGGKLKYAYLSSYNDDKADVCTVDSFLSVGTNISIETSSKTITKDGTTRYVPYISYFTDALKLAKVAWPVTLGKNESSKNTNTFTNGVENDKFTGSWEVQVIPTNLTTTLLNYTIGVGEKKKDTTNQSVMLGYGTKTGLETALLY